jgi:type IV secretory pathway VirB2 component (pilin)
MLTTDGYTKTFIALALLLLCCVSPADAQNVGGGGGGGSAFVSWLLTILDVVFGLAIVFCGLMLMRGHGEWMILGFVCLGILIAEHWQDVLNALKAGI